MSNRLEAREVEGGGKRFAGQKVYLVLVPVRLPRPGRSNVRIVCARGNFTDAALIADRIEGAKVQKFYIGKGEPTPDEFMSALAD